MTKPSGNVRRIVRLSILIFVIWGAFTLVRGYWQRDEQARETAQAYEFVEGHGELISHLACFCGCVKRNSHSSLDTCFVSRRDESGRVIARDPHAITCPVCISEARDAEHMLHEGKSAAEIRRAVDARYDSGDASMKTATPPPPPVAEPPPSARAQ